MNLHLLILLVHIIDIHMRNLGVLSIEDLSHFLERHAAGLDEEDDDKDYFEEEPALSVEVLARFNEGQGRERGRSRRTQ